MSHVNQFVYQSLSMYANGHMFIRVLFYYGKMLTFRCSNSSQNTQFLIQVQSDGGNGAQADGAGDYRQFLYFCKTDFPTKLYIDLNMLILELHRFQWV